MIYLISGGVGTGAFSRFLILICHCYNYDNMPVLVRIRHGWSNCDWSGSSHTIFIALCKGISTSLYICNAPPCTRRGTGDEGTVERPPRALYSDYI